MTARTSAPVYLPLSDASGDERTLFVYRPQGYGVTAPPAGGYSLVCAFHGNGGTQRGMEYTITAMDQVADKYGFVVLYVEGRGSTWDFSPPSPTDDVSILITRSLPAVFQQLNRQVNPRKIFLAGYSDGGAMTIDTMTRNPGMFAGIGIIAYNLNPTNTPTLAGLPPLPVYMCHGTADPVIPINGGIAHSGQYVYSSYASAQTWAGLNFSPNVNNPTQATVPSTLNDGSTSTNTRYTFAAGANGYQVVYDMVGAAGHTWPGGNQPPTANVGGQAIGLTCTSLSASESFWLTCGAASAPGPLINV